MLVFGKKTTLLYAENGSGKTPILQALAYCLGFPAKFREDILSHCAAACLSLDHAGKTVHIRREFTKDFNATITSEDEVHEFFSESDFSTSLFKKLQLEPPILVSTSKHAAQPYMATVLPLFYLNQGDGYTTAYKSPSSFIEDQFVEMVRFLFGLNPKHSYAVKKNMLAEREALERINRKIVSFQKITEERSRGVDSSEGNINALKQRSISLKGKIENLRSDVDATGSANATLIELVRSKDAQIRSTQNEIEDLRSRVSGIESIRSEIEGEIQTLGLNEESRRVFISFNEICGAKNCGLFMGSSESYGKNLLYLRDQIKDLERNSDRAEIQLNYLDRKLKELHLDRATIVKSFENGPTHGVDQLISAVHELTKQLVETENELASIEVVKSDRSKLFSFELERSKIQDSIEALSTTGRSDVDFNKLKLRLRLLMVKWMDILETLNVSRNIEIDRDLRFSFDGEGLDLFSGSTKIRLVLAIHAALFEEYLSGPGRPFRFIILDTPKQQELRTADLAKYLHKLEEICRAKDAQIILSSTEYKHPTGEDDELWLPNYEGPDHPMYLGAATQFINPASDVNDPI